MGNKVDYGAMQNLLDAYRNATDGWSKGIANVMDKAVDIQASSNIAGNRAYNMKQYLSMAYSCAKDALSLVLSLFLQNFIIYNEDYHGLVDAAADTHITADELSNLHSDLKEKRRQVQKIGLAAESAVGKITDLISLPSLGIEGPDGKFDKILTSLDDLDKKINDLESMHSSGDFTEIDTTISWLDSYLAELIGQSKDFKTNFSAGSFANLASVPGLIASMHEGYARIEAQEGEIATALSRLEKGLEQEKQTKWAVLGLAGSVKSWDTKIGTIDALYGKTSFEKYAAWDAKKGDIGVGVKASASGSLLKIENEGRYGIAKGGYEVDVGTAKAEGKATINVISSGKVDPELELKAKAKAEGITGKVEGSLGSDDFDVHLKGEGTVGKATAEAKIAVSKDGIGAKAEAGAAVFSGKATGGVTILGVRIDTSIEGEAISAGAKAEFGVTDSSFEIGGKLSFIAGLGLKVKVSW